MDVASTRREATSSDATRPLPFASFRVPRVGELGVKANHCVSVAR